MPRLERAVRTRVICQRYRPLLDHKKAWATPGEDLVLTAEPYEINGEALAAFTIECVGLGLVVTLSGTSPHAPGHTFMLVVRRGE